MLILPMKSLSSYSNNKHEYNKVYCSIVRLFPHLFNSLFQCHLIKQIDGAPSFASRLHTQKRRLFLLFQLAESRFARHLQRLLERCRNTTIFTLLRLEPIKVSSVCNESAALFRTSRASV